MRCRVTMPGGEEGQVYRVFEALDELVTTVEEARGVPMTSSCVVPRGDVLELLDDIRDAIPAELDDAQDVLDQRDDLLGEGQRQRDEARSEAERTLAEARAEAERTLAEARSRAESLRADAQAEADHVLSSARHEYQQLTARAEAEADRLMTAGRAAYERAVHDGRAEQARLVGQTEVVQAARMEAARLHDEVSSEVHRLRSECDTYIDASLGEIEDMLGRTLRTIARGRSHVAGPVSAGLVDYPT